MNKSPYAWPTNRPLRSAFYGYPRAQGRYEFPLDVERVGTDNGALASHTVNLPTLDVAQGDLMIAGMALNVGGTHTMTGFTLVASLGENSLNNYWYYRVCDGTEGATTTLTAASGTPILAGVVALIKNAYPWTSAAEPKYAQQQSLRNPPSLTVAGRGPNVPFLWISFGFNMANSAASDPGTNDYFLAAGSSTARVGYASYKKRGTTHDPGTFGGGTSNNNGLTICVAPRGIRV